MGDESLRSVSLTMTTQLFTGIALSSNVQETEHPGCVLLCHKSNKTVSSWHKVKNKFGSNIKRASYNQLDQGSRAHMKRGSKMFTCLSVVETD